MPSHGANPMIEGRLKCMGAWAKPSMVACFVLQMFSPDDLT